MRWRQPARLDRAALSPKGRRVDLASVDRAQLATSHAWRHFRRRLATNLDNLVARIVTKPIKETVMEMPKWLRWALGMMAFAVATVGVVWLSGFLFFLFSKANPFGKTDFSTWWTYWHFYQDNAVISRRLKVSGLVAAVVCYGAVCMAIIGAMQETVSLHGDARFATKGEVEKAGLFGKTGIIVGKWGNTFILFAGMQFVLLAAPTRSFKGVGVVIPNLMNWRESAVVLDVKLENYKITSLFRSKHGQKVFLWNPFAEDGRTHRYNCLGYISDNPRLRVTEILAQGYAFYSGAGKDAFFDDAARNLFLGLGLYLCETPALPRTMGELLRQSSGKGKPIKSYLQGIINQRNYREYGDISLVEIGKKANRDEAIKVIMAICDASKEDAKSLIDDLPCMLVENAGKAELDRIEESLKALGKHVKFEVERRQVPLEKWDGVGEPMLTMECVDALNRFMMTSDNTLSSIMASFNTPLTLWTSPIVDAATSANDFDLREVRKQRMTVYVGIPANKLAEAELLLNVFFSQLVTLNTDELLFAKPELQYQCLMVMDEFAAPGRIGIIDKANLYMAGYGMRLLTIIQSPSQIEAEPRRGYGKEGAGTLITNHALQILYTPRKQSDANEYSEMLGTYTFKAKGTSRQRGGKNAGGHSESESDQKRALMMPQELKEMSQRKQIISLENTKPIKCDKIVYFTDHVFIDRFKSVCPTLAALDQTPIRRALRKLGFAAKAIPSKAFFETTWGAGELSSEVPFIDFDIHEAIVNQRSRSMTTGDVAKGIDLRALALDTSKIKVPVGAGLEPEQIENFVNNFFDALDARSAGDDDTDDDGAGNRPSDEELAALDAEAIDGEGDEAGGDVEERMTVRVTVENTLKNDMDASGGLVAPKVPDHDTDEGSTDEERAVIAAHAADDDEGYFTPMPAVTQPAPVDGKPDTAELSDEEMTAMMDAAAPADDAIGVYDEADMLAAIDAMEQAPDYPEKTLGDTPILDLSVLDRPLAPDKTQSKAF